MSIEGKLKDLEAQKELDLLDESFDRSNYDNRERDIYGLRAEELELRSDIESYKQHQLSYENAANRLSQLPDVRSDGTYDFMQELVRELRRCYRERELAAPLHEDRGDSCFHSDIEYALERLREGGNAFAGTWNFVRERTPEYRNLRDSRGNNTNPDFISLHKDGQHGHLVIEAKLGSILSNKPERDRYKGQQADYLSCNDCRGVLLLVYEDVCTGPQLREELQKELNSIFDMRAVAVGVVHVKPSRREGEDDAGQDQAGAANDAGSGEEIEHEESDIHPLFENDWEEEDDVDEPSQEEDESEEVSVRQSDHLIQPDQLNGDPRLKQLWDDLKAEQPQANRARVLDQCFFDVPLYMLEIWKHLRNDTVSLEPADAIPEMLAGGSTQMGKTMFVVIGVCVAKKLHAASIVITHKNSGRNSLQNKLRHALEALNEHNYMSDLRPKSMAYADSNETHRMDTIDRFDCVVIADTSSQITEARGSMYKIIQNLQSSDPSNERKGRFILFKDEADSMLRTQDRRLRLEHSIDLLTPTTHAFRGAQLVVNISATLMPIFLEMARTKSQPRGPVFFTSVPQNYREHYVGVKSFMPLESGERSLHPELDDDDMVQDQRVFLDPKLSRDESSLGINEQVEAIFGHACENGGGKKALLLDITLTKVYAPGSIFDKAEKMQEKYPSIHVVVYCGRGVVVRLAEDYEMPPNNEQTVPSHGKVKLPLWTRRMRRPSGGRQGGSWYTGAKHNWGNGTDIGSVIGPDLDDSEGQRVARVDEVLNALEHVLAASGREDDPIAVFGYTMMARGESFVTDKRIPSHLVLFMSKAASFDLLVQTAGRATAMRKRLLEENNWVDDKGEAIVRVLMPQTDYNVITAYPDLVAKVDECLRGDKRPEELFGSAESELNYLLELRDFSDSQRQFGDRRKNYPTEWMGRQERQDDGESLASVLERLQLPKRNNKLWFDHAPNKWYECKVVEVRIAQNATPEYNEADIQYRLMTTDPAEDFSDTWKILDAANWRRRKEDIPGFATGHAIIHEPWTMHENGTIRRVVLDVLRRKDIWMTVRDIELELEHAAESGNSYGGVVGVELRHCMVSDGGCLPGMALQSLFEREVPKISRRRSDSSVPRNAKVAVRHKDKFGIIQNLFQDDIRADGPLIVLESPSGAIQTQTATQFTNKPHAWPYHLLVVEHPVGTPLSYPVSYEDYVGSSNLSYDANSTSDPQGLFEYKYDRSNPNVHRARRTQNDSPGAMHMSPEPSRRRGREPDSDRPSRSRRQRVERAPRQLDGTRMPVQPMDVDPDMTRQDMRTLIEQIEKALPNREREVLQDLLRKGLGLSKRDVETLSEDELKRTCKNLCDDGKVKWSHLNKLDRGDLRDICFRVNGGDDETKKRSEYVSLLQNWVREPEESES